METHTYPHFPLEVSTVHLALYTHVTNAAELRRRLVNAATLSGDEGMREREAANYAFVNVKPITSRLHILTAVLQAVLAYSQGSLRTKTIHSEILWALNPGHNISEAIKRFGVSDSTQDILVIRVCPPTLTSGDFGTNASLAVHGKILPLSSLEQLTDWALVRKYYKLNNDTSIGALLSNPTSLTASECSFVEELVVTSVAMKSVSA